MNLLKNKKHTEIRKETAPLKMKRGQKKLFALYAVMVLSICIGATCVYAAGDPLTVVNNLSTFIFSLIRAIGPDPAGIWYRAGRSVLKEPRSKPEGKRISDTGRRYHHYFCKRDPGPDHGIGEETRRGAMRNAGSLLTFAGWEVKLFD